MRPSARGPAESGVSLARPPLGTVGWWTGDETVAAAGDDEALGPALRDIGRRFHVIRTEGGRLSVVEGGIIAFDTDGTEPSADARPVLAHVPPCPLESLGDPTFCADHGVRYAYVAGSMANGIASTAMVEAMARKGMLAFFGAAGLPVGAVEAAILRLKDELGGAPFGFNLIHSPNEPGLEAAVVDLYLRHGIKLIEASAYLDLTLPVVRYRVAGIHRSADGKVVAPNRIIAKASRLEVATKFFSPPPEGLLRELVARRDITAEQAELAAAIPMAQDLTAEADSGGHTDNRPAVALLPTLIALRDRLQAEHGYDRLLRVGAAGGIGTPHAAAAAFAMGAAYVVTGSVNQACVEAGTSENVREMLAMAGQADVAMAPAADMFEMGVRVQVLKRGTMFAMRGARLYELYKAHDSLEDIPAAEREKLTKTIFRASFEEVLDQTRAYFVEQDPAQWERATSDPKHRMALAFRWYLGLASHWANSGDDSRRMDYQVWCGPAMGAFNEWVRGTFLAEPRNRTVALVALNILHGAAVLCRMNAARGQGVPLTAEQQRLVPLDTRELEGMQQ